MGRTKQCLFIFLLTIIMFMLVNSTIAMKPKGFTLRMIHKDSEESPLYNPLDRLVTPDERFETLIDQSRARARYIASQITLAMNPDVVAPVIYEVATFYYAANVGIGTFTDYPGFMDYYLLIDSGSDLTWLQCDGATKYFNQVSPRYPWKRSQSYHPILCRDPSRGCPYCNKKGQCVYTNFYINSQVTSGVFAEEKFTFNTRTGGSESFLLIMGCGLHQENFTMGINDSENRIAGILGLGRGEHSFVTQLGPGGGKFSYCFEKYSRRRPPNTYLSFGADAWIGERFSRTPIVPTNTSFYYLNLEGISVAGAIVPIPRREFQFNHDDQTGGCIIDSGAPMTTMYRNIFDTVTHSVDLYFGQFGMRRADFSELHACYEPRNGIEYTKPTIKFHFQQAAPYVVSETWYKKGGNICLAITKSDSNKPAVLFGAWQQTNKRILYDNMALRVSFADEECGRGPRG